MKTLDDMINDGIVELGRGKVISKKDLADFPGTYPVYSSAKNNEGKFGEYGKYMFDEELITWSVDGGGRLFYRPKHRFSITNVGGYIRIKRPDLVSYRFLYFCLSLLQSRIQFDWVKKAHPSVIRKLYKDIPLPPLPEQKRIVAILDEAFAGIDTAIANTEKNLANARELFESYLNSVFGQRGDGWNHAKFSEVVSTVRPPSKVQRKEFLESGQFPIVSQEQGTINGWWSRQKDVIRVDKPVIIFGDHTRVFKYIDFDFVTGSDGTKILRAAPFLHPKYLYYFAQSVPLEGLGYARHYRILKDADVWYPEDVSEQEAISIQLDELVEDLNKLDAVYNRRLSALTELKQSLLQKAFSGELTADAADAVDTVEGAQA